MNINIVFRSFAIAVMMALISFSAALAHGEPIITVEPSIAVPGGQITITGADMEDGEIFKITLESAAGVFELGEAIATQDGDEAGFAVTFTLPTGLTAGSYLVRAATDEGETATADLTISVSDVQMESQRMEASAEPLSLDRPRSGGLMISVVLAALLSAVLGLWLIRRPG
ncbi:MAG: lytic polysaccharide monooxygenase auxiliary activity family 9 protein [Anaerolineales bacterium]|nr:lytic polysaccharide monooxygenase auxiliary activity family 9 protein [Anaerolineales bacterium]